MKKVRLTMKKKRLTMSEVIKEIQYNAHSEYNVPLLNITLSDLPEWYNAYKENYSFIDEFVVTKFSDYVLDNYESVNGTITPAVLVAFLKRKSNSFYMLRKLTYDKLWEIESITFNPINNYDSHKKSTMVRTGAENDLNNKLYEKMTENTQNGSVVDSLEKSGTETVATKNNQTETNARELNTATNVTAKNNQSVTVTDTKRQSYKDSHTLTAYANNEVDATERTYAGDGDTNITTFSGDGDTNNTTNTGTDTTTKSYTGDADTTEQSFNQRKDEKTTTYNDLKTIVSENVTKDTEERTKTYNAVTDTFEEMQSGNIGVTTSTAMLQEFVQFYGNYSFFECLIGDFVQFICRADFETGVE